MNKTGPIVVIEDDMDDQEVLAEVFKNLDYQNEVIYFADGNKALSYLVDGDNTPFLILSDINMPKLNGFELRDKVYQHEQLKKRCIPYLFFTTSGSQQDVINAYSTSAQGFFIKPSTLPDLQRTIKKIVEYWQECVSPNNVPATAVKATA